MYYWFEIAMAKKKHHRPSLLSSTRPPRSKPTPSLSSRLTRTIVRCHHDLRKQLATAAARNDDEETQTILNKIEDLGGCK